MSTGGGLVTNRGRRFKWAIELSGPGSGGRGRSDRGSSQGDTLYPIGYSDKQVPDTSVQETDRILVEKRCWDIALGPLKQIPMNLFIMYMAGNTISIFPTMMVCMMAWRPIQALMSISATFKLLESSSQKFLQGLVYLIGNLLGLALAVYKCQSMGLLPTHASDWLAFIEPPERDAFDATSGSAAPSSKYAHTCRQRCRCRAAREKKGQLILDNPSNPTLSEARWKGYRR
uniref:ER membrane protein complex subunit 4 n=1 Tax=Naja naja TaxID=35670 RepID=A0A8C6XIJ4_NAJNA